MFYRGGGVACGTFTAFVWCARVACSLYSVLNMNLCFSHIHPGGVLGGASPVSTLNATVVLYVCLGMSCSVKACQRLSFVCCLCMLSGGGWMKGAIFVMVSSTLSFACKTERSFFDTEVVSVCSSCAKACRARCLQSFSRVLGSIWGVYVCISSACRAASRRYTRRSRGFTFRTALLSISEGDAPYSHSRFVVLYRNTNVSSIMYT
eukprot:3936078-Rhodomonas_salina.2